MQEAEVAKKRALMYYKSEDWEKAREAAKSATQLAQQDPEAFLLLGACEQKLENYVGAIEAFKVYLRVAPNGNKAPQVRQRITELELREKTRKGNIEVGIPDRFSGKGAGAFIGIDPVHRPRLRDLDDLTSDMGMSFTGGFEIDDMMSIGLRYGRGSTGPLTVRDASGLPVSVASADHQMFELFFLPRINLNRPYKDLGWFQLYIPLYFGLPYNRIVANGQTFWNLGATAGTGFGVRLYTTTLIAFDATGFYHFGFSFWDLRESSGAPSVQNFQGNNVRALTTGFDLRFSLTFFFR
jgi:tetratricopeptide (TPR) repeat protein